MKPAALDSGSDSRVGSEAFESTSSESERRATHSISRPCPECDRGMVTEVRHYAGWNDVIARRCCRCGGYAEIYGDRENRDDLRQ